MKFVVDKAVPFMEGVLEPYGSVVYKDGTAIGKDDVRNADALIIRTRTRCNESLLEGSSVKIIATATIGTDHIDLQYCKERGIWVQNAAGCNAGGVMNYVLSAIYGVASRRRISLENACVGIIGVGNVGSRVDRALRLLGFKTLLNDPPRAAAEGSAQFCDLDYLLRNSDIVTIHTPLNDNTRELANSHFFSMMKLGAIFINAARGEIVAEEDLMEAGDKLGAVILDTWCNEPRVSRELVEKATIATPHIAGYSYQGKLLGTAMSVKSIARYFSIKELYDFFPTPDSELRDSVKLDLRGKSQGEIASAIQYNYPIFTDDFMFRMNPERFEQLRQNYPLRREFFID